MAIIQATDLVKTYRVFQKKPGLTGALRALVRRESKEVRAVDGVSFTIEPGEMVAFLGPNGAGKTTTLKVLSGLIYPTSGSAQVLGFTPWDRAAAFRRRFALVDEPTIGLDVVGQVKIQKCLREYNQTRGVTMLLTSHYMRDVEALCHRVLVISHGKVVFDGPLDRISEQFGQAKLLHLEFADSAPQNGLERYGEVTRRQGP